MSITSFDKIKGVGVYPNFTWPRELESFKAFNLIYGWNGSGKTTLSRLLRYLENNVLPEDWEPEFKISTSGGAVENSNPDFLSGSICVFNVDFVEENIKWSEGRTKKLLIGKATQELATKLSADRLTLKNDREKNTEENKSLEKAQKDRDNFLQKRASEIKKRLTTNIQDQYRNYNSPKLKESILALENQDAVSHALDMDKETLLNAEIQQNAMPELSAVHFAPSHQCRIIERSQRNSSKIPSILVYRGTKKRCRPECLGQKRV